VSPGGAVDFKHVRRALVYERLNFAFSLSGDLDSSSVLGSTTIVPDVAGRHGTRSTLCRSVGQRGRVGRGSRLPRWLRVAHTSARWGVVSEAALPSYSPMLGKPSPVVRSIAVLGRQAVALSTLS
jgi:hypothetical protein